jgi:hypothetical protein
MAKKTKKKDGYIDLTAAQKAQHEAWRPLTVREANRLALGRAKVSVDPEDASLWRVERDDGQRVQAHEPMTREAWLAFLDADEVAPAGGGAKDLAVLRYTEYRQDVDHLLDFLGQELRKHTKQAKADAGNFGFTGDLYRLRSCLVEVLAGLRGVEIEDIERCL